MRLIVWRVKWSLTAIIIAAAFAIATVVSAFCWIYEKLYRYLNCGCNNKSQNPSLVSLELGITRGRREFSLKEIKQATNNFGEANFIGNGSFGPVYKGVFGNATIAVKKRLGGQHPGFVTEVTHLSKIRHCNLVNLLGFCCENGNQMLVYEYFNGSLRNHLYSGLEFKKRISIAIGSGKALQYLHSLNPPLIHKRFSTAKVLLDGNFNAKVSDALELREEAASHSRVTTYVFCDPKVGSGDQETYTEKSDVYSFGVFLLELMTGEEPKGFSSNEELNKMISSRSGSNAFVDERIAGTVTRETATRIEMIMLKCLMCPEIRRPKMEEVVMELEKIYEKDVVVREEEGEDSSRVILGSELFRERA